MKKLEIIVRPTRLNEVKDALVKVGVHGMSVTEIKGFGRQGGHTETYRGNEVVVEFLPKIKIEIVIESAQVEEVLRVVREAANTNTVGDGKIFIVPVDDAVRIRTGENGYAAL